MRKNKNVKGVLYVFSLFKTFFNSTDVLEDEMPKFTPKVHNFTKTPFLCKIFPGIMETLEKK